MNLVMLPIKLRQQKNSICVGSVKPSRRDSAMSRILDLEKEAYAIAWPKLRQIETLAPDEIEFGSSRLRYYIKILAEVGEDDPNKIANAAMGMIRQFEQMLH
jgi:hypothetical protein